jgi:PIN domain nuclease of toxin-antitoxin system
MAAARRKPRTVRESSAPYTPRRILLDTHVWLWWHTGDRRLGREAVALIRSAPDVRFSAASAWEIAIKRSLGKLVIRGELEIARELERDGFTELAVSVAHAETVHDLPTFHRDPFDRMLVAQAQVEGLAIVTADDAIAKYGVSVVDARR